MPTPPKALRRRPDDLALFTGRKAERERLEQLIATLLGQSTSPAPLITQFHGLGGIGKSFLRLWIEQYWKDLPPADHKRLRLAAINLDVAHVWTLSTPVADFWWQVRMAVNRAGIPTVFCDDLYFTLWKRLHPGHAKPEHKGFFGELLEGCSKAAEGGEVASHADPALDGLRELLKEVQDSVKSLKLVNSLATYLRDRHRQRHVKERVGFDPASLDEAQQVNRLPEFIARDVQDYLTDHPKHAFALLVDGFERVQSVTGGDDIQHSFERFCGCVALGGEAARRAAVVVFGRDPLKWDTLYSDPEWPRYWSLQPVTGWPEPDARAFLLTAESEYDQIGDTGTATRIRQHSAAILQAAYSEKVGPVIGSWHPFHLALAVDMVADHGAKFTEEMLGLTPHDLLDRFTRYLDTERRRAYHLFALAVDFDEPIFRFFVEQHLLPGYGVTQFAEAATPWASYVTESRITPGRYRFHRLMQEMLLRSLRENDAYLAAARQDLGALLDHFLTASRFVNEAALDAPKLAAYARGLEILLYHAEDSLGNPPSPPDLRALLMPDKVCQLFRRFQQGFGAGSRAAFRLPFHERLARYAEMALDEISTEAAYVYNEVAVCHQVLAAFEKAEPLLRRAIAIDELNYGANHPQIAIHLNNLAQLLLSTNRLKDAEPLLRRALMICETAYGLHHPEIAIRLNNLAQLLQPTNRLGEAERLLRRAIRIGEISYGVDHPIFATQLNNLAQVLQATNRLKEAEPLVRRALAVGELNLGADHPLVASRLSNLAQLLQASNRLKEAEPLLRRALAIDEAAYGIDHPDVAADLNNLAQLLQATNRLQEAEPLMRRALAIDEVIYGINHPTVAIRLNNLGALLKATNRLGEAEVLMRQALSIDEASYGADHPKVAIRLNNLASLLDATNRPAEAEPLMRRALSIDAANYGPGHPKVAIRLNNLATILKVGDRMGEAELLVRRALAIDEISYEADHPRIAIDLNNLAQ